MFESLKEVIGGKINVSGTNTKKNKKKIKNEIKNEIRERFTEYVDSFRDCYAIIRTDAVYIEGKTITLSNDIVTYYKDMYPERFEEAENGIYYTTKESLSFYKKDNLYNYQRKNNFDFCPHNSVPDGLYLSLPEIMINIISGDVYRIRIEHEGPCDSHHIFVATDESLTDVGEESLTFALENAEKICNSFKGRVETLSQRRAVRRLNKEKNTTERLYKRQRGEAWDAEIRKRTSEKEKRLFFKQWDESHKQECLNAFTDTDLDYEIKKDEPITKNLERILQMQKNLLEKTH